MATQANRLAVTEKDLVDAFFSETPFGFHGPMKCDMDEFGIDYTQYGYDKYKDFRVCRKTNFRVYFRFLKIEKRKQALVSWRANTKVK